MHACVHADIPDASLHHLAGTIALLCVTRRVCREARYFGTSMNKALTSLASTPRAKIRRILVPWENVPMILGNSNDITTGQSLARGAATRLPRGSRA